MTKINMKPNSQHFFFLFNTKFHKTFFYVIFEECTIIKNSSTNILTKVKEKVAIPFLNISSCSKQFLRIYILGWIKEKIRYSSIKTSNTVFKKSDKNNDDSNKIQKTETFFKPKLSHTFLNISQWKKKITFFNPI